MKIKHATYPKEKKKLLNQRYLNKRIDDMSPVEYFEHFVAHHCDGRWYFATPLERYQKLTTFLEKRYQTLRRNYLYLFPGMFK